ncbi:MAG: LysE family translocator [Gammaproteobacteria bacterium]|nr:LysE family translocator [Gammaproteobacteria bacterium]
MTSTLLILASITFVSMMSPGPDMILLVKYSSAYNRWPAVKCIAGICCGLLVHVGLSILGIAAVIAASATLYSIMKFAGAGYLIYIGLKSLFSGGGLTFNETEKSILKKRSRPFLDGLLCNVLNPKVTIFILAVFTQVVEPSTPVMDKIIYGLFIIFEAFVVWNFFVILVRTKLVLGFIQRFQITIDRVVGVFLIGFGSALALDEAR